MRGVGKEGISRLPSGVPEGKTGHPALDFPLAETTGAACSSFSPQPRKTTATSCLSAAGISRISQNSRARSEAQCSRSVRAARQPPGPIAVEPAAISASPATTITPLELAAPDNPATGANGSSPPSRRAGNRR